MNNIEEFLEAAKAGDAGRLGALLDNDPTLMSNARNETGVSAFMLAVYCGHSDVVNLLLDRGIELNIFEAAAAGQTRRIEILLDRDPALVNAHSPDGFTPLTLASFFGRKEVIEILLARGADPEIVSKNAMGVRPINSAMAHRQPQVALAMGEMLLAHGANPNVAQMGGWTPLHEAAAHGHADKARLLLTHNADPNALSDDGKTPLQMALDANHTEVAEILRQHGALENV
jgi:uncharacterized protein